MMDLSDKKVGLVLSGGGAKGAYQIGMLRALEEAGLKKENMYLAGSSIGALVSLVYACRDIDAVRGMFYGLSDAMNVLKANAAPGRAGRTDAAAVPGGDASGSAAEEAAKKEAAAAAGAKISAMLMQAMEQLLPDELLLKNHVPVSVCCYSINKKRPVYFDLQDLAPSRKRTLVMASASIPGLYPAVAYEGDMLVDGGVVPPELKDAAPADKVPAVALKDAPIGIEFVSFLTQYDEVRPESVHPTAKCVRIRPSRPLEDRPHAGTLDFSKEKLMSHEALGYEDTINLLKTL